MELLYALVGAIVGAIATVLFAGWWEERKETQRQDMLESLHEDKYK